MQYVDNICIPRHNPCVQEGIPVHRGFSPQLVIERIRIREHLRIKQVVEAEHPIFGALDGKWRGVCDHAGIPPGEDSRTRCASSSLIRFTFARIRLSISEEISRTVG